MSGNFGFPSVASAGLVGGAGNLSAGSAVAASSGAQMLSGALAVQTAGNLQAAGGAGGIDPLATLALALLLQKSNQSEEKQDPFQALAMLAMLGGMQQAGGASASASFSFSMSGVDQAYAGGAVASVSLSAQA
ncbi:MAG: hypothetical protein QM775_23410 [Pirellulales bacterium]